MIERSMVSVVDESSNITKYDRSDNRIYSVWDWYMPSHRDTRKNAHYQPLYIPYST